MKKKYCSSMALTAICLLLGVIIGTQYNTVQKQNATVGIQRVTELSASLKKEQTENESLRGQVRDYEKKLREYEDSISGEGRALQALKSELDQVRSVSGFTALRGRGITVTLNDSNNATKNGGDINAYLVHAEDILSIINELNVAGAEAISINGQRIIGVSSVRCVGSVVNINGTKVASPFVISAIGNPDILESALVFPGGVVDSLSPWGIEITIKKQSNVTVAAYTQPIQNKEARPVEKGEDKS